MKRGFAFVWTLLLFFLFASAANGQTASTLIRNGGAEEANGSDPASWSREVYAQGASGEEISALTLGADGGHTGSRYLRIQSAESNDARWVQTVAVEPDTVYRLSAWVRASGIDPARTGANVSVLGIGSTSADVKDTQGQWVPLEMYGRTGPDQREIGVAVRLGGYGNLNAGTADFDDIALEAVEAAPAGATVLSLTPDELPPAGATSGTSSHAPYVTAMFLFAAAYALLGYWAVLALRKGEGGLPDPDTRRGARYAVLLFAGALALRVVCAPIVAGHPIDILDFYAWANHAYEAGLPGFYTADMFVDYPPGYIYVLYVIGLFQHVFALEYQTSASLIFLKLPSIVADLLAAWVVFRLARKYAGARVAAVLAPLYLLNPMVFHNSVVWGQIDSVFTLFVLLSVWLIAENKLARASACLVVAILIKPQAVVLIPVLLIALWRRKDGKAWARAILYGAAAFVLLVLPFSIGQKPWWIVERYRAMFESYPYATLNAANLYGLLGLNAAKLTSGMTVSSNLFVVLIVVFIAVLAYRYRQRPVAHYAYLAFLTHALVFALKTNMHERYGYPAVVLALLAYALLKDRRMLWMFLALTFTHFADVAYVFKFSLDKQYYLAAGDGWFRFLSLCNIVIAGYAAYVGWTPDKAVGKSPAKAQTGKAKPRGAARPAASDGGIREELSANAERRMKRIDRLLVTGLTAVYAILAFVNLGTMRNPDTAWKPGAADSAVVYDFGQPATVASVLWYGGIGDGAFELSQSSDGQNWTPALQLELNGGTVFQWKQQPVSFTARYARLTATKPGGTLYELAFRDDMQRPIAPTSANPEEGARLIDEPGSVPDKPSYLNSMYFDEIYHARTAYEFLHHIEPYETTHPPLGKALISLGVAIFGMNPFGWRVVGTLFGIAMIPMLYLFAKRLFGKTEYAFLAAFLLAFDFMHFTQTRIATIDVYGVFFILMMYYYMYKFYIRSLGGASFRACAAPLGLAGLFFGIGAASKWIDIYAGAGLAVILAIALYRRYRERRFLWQVVGWCCLAFLLVPAVIYTLSYIPFFLVPGPGHDFQGMLNYQKFMFNYHSHLVATHPFASSWWEWPLIVKPIWYYAGSVAPGYVSSIAALGNPAVWWVGTAAVFAAIGVRLRKPDPRLTFLLVGLAAEYLPWVGVQRLTFIYHFFASIPFLILLAVYLIMLGRESRLLSRGAVYAYMGVVLGLFILFYPVLSGMTVKQSYVAHALKWFSSWYFGA
ncbi:glycosyltransferase family 39 protein [Cohnella nanjingensis]|uniref:Glycosyltransferase family 39 protein n=1 Tax=Cohnella nanjingensis TaxID=1387779 RepID=A0A7X0VI55_9BACL|nr:glycosyltransferase family 39 protein [Cohnella nanjingensis]MBB6674857.1 glycosyltransferase family 39 protein [Cohnella nanjingensis]